MYFKVFKYLQVHTTLLEYKFCIEMKEGVKYKYKYFHSYTYSTYVQVLMYLAKYACAYAYVT